MFKRFIGGILVKDKGKTADKTEHAGWTKQKERGKEGSLGRRRLRLPWPGQQRVPEEGQRQEESLVGQE